MDDKVQENIIRFVRKHISSYTSLRVMWFGGEPLLRKDIIVKLSKELIDICRKAKRNYTAQITTNGYLLTEQVFRELLSCHVIEYQITLDGFESTHDKQRVLKDGGGTYWTIINNLQSIRKNVKTARFIVNLRTNFTKAMILDVKKYIDWFHEEYEFDPRFLLCLEVARDFGGERVQEVLDQLISSEDIEMDFFNEIMKSDLRNTSMDIYNFLTLTRPGGHACYASLRNSFYIDTVGNIRKCGCRLDDDLVNIVGKVDDNRGLNIDYKRNLSWSLVKKEEKCKECVLLPVCLGLACPYRKLKNGKLECPGMISLLPKYLELYDKINLCSEID